MRKMLLSLSALALISAPAFGAVKVGDKAPAFAGIPAIDGDKETNLALSDIKEDVVVVVFLANHCPAVTTYEDRIIDLAKGYKGKSVKLVAVSVSDTAEDDLDAIKARVKDRKYNFVYGSDVSQQIGKDFGAVVTPQFFVLDKGRTVQYIGALDDSMQENKVEKTYLKDAIDAVLKGESVEVSKTQARGCGIGYKKSK
ncbi:redoxin domain-containing protein [Isosphaeraceae bacterium EP7]